jgi:hypothetical protein
MSKKWYCPRCNTINRKPDYVLRLSQLSQSLGRLSIGTSGEPAPHCSQCDFEADVNAMLEGEYDALDENTPEPLPEPEEKPLVAPLDKPNKIDQLSQTVVGVVAAVLICGICALTIGAGIYFSQTSGNGVSLTPLPSKTEVVPTQTETKFISTQTEIEIPPLVIEGCNPADECPDTVTVLSLFAEGSTLAFNVEHKVTISLKDRIRFSIRWCAVDTKTLDDNLPHTEFVFTINGESFIEQMKTNRDIQQDSNDPTIQMYCYSVGGVASEWMPGQTYRIVFGLRIKDTINDGWDTYAPVDYLRIYLIAADPNRTSP